MGHETGGHAIETVARFQAGQVAVVRSLTMSARSRSTQPIEARAEPAFLPISSACQDTQVLACQAAIVAVVMGWELGS